MESMSSEAAETKIDELSEILNKVLQIITKALDDLTVKMVGLEERVYSLDQRINDLQNKAQNIKISQPIRQIIQQSNDSKGIPVNSPKIIKDNTESQQKTPVPTGGLVNTELKDLFKKLKKGK